MARINRRALAARTARNRRRPQSLADFVMLPGVPNKALNIPDGTKAATQLVGDQAGLPIPDNMLPSLPNTTAQGFYTGTPYIKSWDGTNVSGGCSQFAQAPCGACGPTVSSYPVPPDNNYMAYGDALMSEDMLRDMMPGGSLAIGTAMASNPYDIFGSAGRAETTLQRAQDALVDPLVSMPTAQALNYSLPGSYSGGLPDQSQVPGASAVVAGMVVGPNATAVTPGSSTGILSGLQPMSEGRALNRLRNVRGLGYGREDDGVTGSDIVKLLVGIGIVYWITTRNS